jgi:hypothetical protein
MATGTGALRIDVHEAIHSLAAMACDIIGPDAEIEGLFVKFHPGGSSYGRPTPATFEARFGVSPKDRVSERQQRDLCQEFRVNVLKEIRELTDRYPALSLKELNVTWGIAVSMWTNITFEVDG